MQLTNRGETTGTSERMEESPPNGRIVVNNDPKKNSNRESSPLRRQKRINGKQEERMKLITKALQDWNEKDMSKLFEIETWCELIQKVKKGAPDERRYVNQSSLLQSTAKNIIEQIASSEYRQRISQMLSVPSIRRGRQLRQGRQQKHEGEFLVLALDYDKRASEKVWNKAVNGEDPVEEQIQLRIKSSQTLETSLKRENNNSTIRRSPILLGMGPDDEVIENDTPPPTPEPEIIIPRKKTKFNFDPSPASLSNTNIRGKIDLSKKLVEVSSFEMDDFPRSFQENRSFLEPYSFDYGFEENSCSTLNGRDFNHDDLPDLEPPDTGTDKENFPKSEQEIVRDYPKPLNCPELKPIMFEEIEEALSRPKKDKIVSAFGLTLTQEQLSVYDKLEWLEDANIDFYLEMIKDRNNRANSGYSKIYIFQSYFYKLLDKRGYESVQGATGKDIIFEYDLVLIPIHCDHHWVLVVVNFNEKTMKCYDSMDHDNERHLRVVGSYLKREWKEVSRAIIASQSMREIKRLSELNDFLEFDEQDDYYLGETWVTLNLGAKNIPQQKNGRDCGVFCLQFAEYLSRGHAFDFEQKHIAYFRKRMLYETLKKTLLIP